MEKSANMNDLLYNLWKSLDSFNAFQIRMTIIIYKGFPTLLGLIFARINFREDLFSRGFNFASEKNSRN